MRTPVSLEPPTVPRIYGLAAVSQCPGASLAHGFWTNLLNISLIFFLCLKSRYFYPFHLAALFLERPLSHFIFAAAAASLGQNENMVLGAQRTESTSTSHMLWPGGGPGLFSFWAPNKSQALCNMTKVMLTQWTKSNLLCSLIYLNNGDQVEGPRVPCTQ